MSNINNAVWDEDNIRWIPEQEQVLRRKLDTARLRLAHVADKLTQISSTNTNSEQLAKMLIEQIDQTINDTKPE